MPAVPGPAALTAAEPPTATQRTPEEEARYQQVRKKLDALNRLRTDGVITEEQYQKQFEEVMKEL